MELTDKNVTSIVVLQGYNAWKPLRKIDLQSKDGCHVILESTSYIIVFFLFCVKLRVHSLI